MLAATMIYDHARAAEKMTNPNCSGDDNVAWKEGPYLSSPANQKQIDRTHPYCLRTSRENGITAGIVVGENPPKNKNGGVHMPLPPKNKNESMVEPAIAKLALIEQFELFRDFFEKEFEKTYNVNINDLTAWENKIDQMIINKITEVRQLRNKLTHDYDFVAPSLFDTMKEYFYELRQIAIVLFELKQSNNLYRASKRQGRMIWIPEKLVNTVKKLVSDNQNRANPNRIKK